MGTSRPRRRLGLPAAAAALVLAVVGVVAIALGVGGQSPPPPQPAPSRAAPDRPEPQTSAEQGHDRAPNAAQQGRSTNRPRQEALPYSRPVRLAIPGIDVSSRLVDLGLDAQGVMETPEPVDRAGWFTPSPPPGVPGAAVIAGHVTWDQEPSVFFRLGELRRGDQVRVERADGAVVEYSVTRVGSFSKRAFPTQAVYDQPDQSELRLITCGGRYDEQANRYLDNVIVWAEVTGVARPGGS
jgi:LPXTG-site transpeptidase (sortase) family protein